MTVREIIEREVVDISEIIFVVEEWQKAVGNHDTPIVLNTTDANIYYNQCQQAINLYYQAEKYFNDNTIQKPI